MTGLPELSAALDVAAYRIVAEAVTNAIRHAEATEVVVRLAVEAGTLVIEVTDNGCGLPAAPVPGLGLTSMRLRAEELGGQLSISTGAGSTSVVARVPVAAQAADAGPRPSDRAQVIPA